VMQKLHYFFFFFFYNWPELSCMASSSYIQKAGKCILYRCQLKLGHITIMKSERQQASEGI
jgi:hypothetical protein